MPSRYLGNRFTPTEPSPEYRALVAFGLWLRAGSVALGVAAIGVIMLTTGEATPWVASATALAGAALAALSWRKARAIVGDLDASESADAPAARSAAGVRGFVDEPAASR